MNVLGVVHMPDKSTLQINGVGDVNLKFSESDFKLSDVLYVPSLKKSLLSLPTLVDQGYDLNASGSDRILRVIHPTSKAVVMTGYPDGKLFKLSESLSNQDSKACLRETVDQGLSVSTPPKLSTDALWHARMGHLELDLLRQMQHSVLGLPKFSRKPLQCKGCSASKFSQGSFPTSTWKTTEELQVIHSAIYGPLPICSLNQKEFYITFIDDFTKKVWIAFLKRRSDAFRTFQAFRARAERESGSKITLFISDNGSEYTSTEFDSYLTANGIKHQLTEPGMNEVAEYMNQTLMNMTRTMLLYKKLPGYLWAEAVSTSMHVINTSCFPDSPSSPDEKWYGRPPCVSHFQIFGSTCYANILPQHRRKLQARAIKGIFVGYPMDGKGYKVFLPEQRKIIVTGDVIFAETQDTLLTLEARCKKMKPRRKDARLYDVQIPEFGGEDTAKLVKILESVNHSNTEVYCDDDDQTVPSHNHIDKGKNIVAVEAEDPVMFPDLHPSSSYSSDPSVSFDQTYHPHEASPQILEGCTRETCQLEKKSRSDKVGETDRARTHQSQPELKDLHLALHQKPFLYQGAMKKSASIHVKQKACDSHIKNGTWKQQKPPWR